MGHNMPIPLETVKRIAVSFFRIDAPIVGYLARSTSAFYALYGGLLLVLSLNLSRYRPLLSCVGIGTILLGAALTGVDRVEGLPFFWQVAEGPFDMAAGTILLLLARSVKEEVSPTIQTRNSDA